MKKLTRLIVAIVILVVQPLILNIFINAQTQVDSSLLTIDRLFNSKEFNRDRLGHIQWINDGEAYTILETSEAIEKAKDIVIYNCKTQKREVLISAKHLIPKGKKNALHISSYTWSVNNDKLLIFTNTKKVWRQHTRGDYWVFNMKNKELTQLGKGLPESSLMFAKFSPINNEVAYVSKSNIYVENLANSNIKQLTKDGTVEIINGTFDWVYEEEFDCLDGFKWSPDGKNIAYWQVDASDTRNFYMINNTDSIYSGIIPIQYPKVGQPPSSVKVGVVEIATSMIKWMKIPGDPRNNYIPRMQWIGDKLLVQQIDRKQQELNFWICNLKSDKVEKIYTEKDEAWVDILIVDLSHKGSSKRNLSVVDNNRYVIRMTEKDGWRHIYKIPINKDDKEVPVTKGNYDVGTYYTIDESEGIIYVNASPNNSTQRYLHKVDLKGEGNLVKLTPEEYSGINTYNIAPNGKYAIHTHSSTKTPPTVHLIKLPDHKIINTLVDNENYKTKVAKLNLPEIEFIKIVTEDGIELDGKMLKPINFDSQKKYPVLFNVYGEPWGQLAVDRWGLGWHTFLAQQGYFVISLDNRGTPCLKGREWRKSIYKNIGIINSRDQAMAVKEILKWDFIDSERIAVWGWSGGGSMTLNLLFRYPEIYKTGMSVAPVANQLYYDNIYQERYMGLVSENPEVFKEGSPITYAKNLEGNLLLVHGTGDDNVHYQNSEALVNELIKHNKQFQIMPYPNRSHGISEGKNTRRHLYTLLTNYLFEHTPPGGK